MIKQGTQVIKRIILDDAEEQDKGDEAMETEETDTSTKTPIRK